MGNFVLGKYLPYDSVIHKMDPRAKILAMLLVLISIFIPAGYLGYTVLGIVIVATVLIKVCLEINETNVVYVVFPFGD